MEFRIIFDDGPLAGLDIALDVDTSGEGYLTMLAFISTPEGWPQSFVDNLARAFGAEQMKVPALTHSYSLAKPPSGQEWHLMWTDSGL